MTEQSPAVQRLATALGLEPWLVEQVLAADPTLAADLELGRRLRDENDPLLADALAWMQNWRRPPEQVEKVRRALVTRLGSRDRE